MIVVASRPDAAPQPPSGESGEPYRYELTYRGGYRRAYADTLAELCGALIDGYDPAAIAARLETDGTGRDQVDDLVEVELGALRIRHAVNAQVEIQAQLNSRWPVDDLGEPQRRVLRGDRTTQPAVTRWEEPVPLVLSTHGYQPDTDQPRPDGNVIWLDPRHEAALLASLHDAGAVRLAERVGPEREEASPEIVT